MADPITGFAPTMTGGSNGIGSLISGLGQLGSGILGATSGGQVAGNFQAQGQNAINAQNAYLGQAVNASNASIGNTGKQLGTSQDYTNKAVGAQQNLFGTAQGLGQSSIGNQNNLLNQSLGLGNQSISNQSNLLNQATGYLQPGIQEAKTGGAGLNQIFNNPGGANNYSGFNNNPGYNFAVQQGQNAINRQAAASGNLYSTNTMANLSQYNTGMASQNYNNYVNQLMQMSGLGNSAAASAGGQAVQTGANQGQTYGQGMSNIQGTGVSQASTYANQMANAFQTGQGEAGSYNQGSINPLTAAGMQNQAYLQQGTNAVETGKGVSDTYTNIGQMNASGTASNFGSLQQMLANPQTSNLVSSLLGAGKAGVSALSSLLGGGSSGGGFDVNSIGAGGLAALNSDPTGVNAAMAASGAGGSNWMSGLSGGSGYGDLTDESGNLIQSAGDINSLAGGGGDISGLLAGFSSAGGQAAGLAGAAPDMGALASSTQGALNGVNWGSSAGSAGGSILGQAGSLLGGAGALNGLVNAFQHPSPGNTVSGALNAYKLYNTASSLLGSGAGGAAAGVTGLASNAAIAGSVAAPDLAGIVTPSASSLLGGTGAEAATAMDSLASGSAATGAGASSALSSIASVAAPLAAVGAIGYMIYNGMQSSPDVITKVGPGQSTMTLQSGQAALREGNYAVGAGSDRSKGSGQEFIIPQSTVTINGKQAVAGKPFALGSGFVTSGDLTLPMVNGKPDFSSITYDPKATKSSPATGTQQMRNMVNGFGVVPAGQQATYNALQRQTNSQSLSASYNNSGGQAAWGVPFQTWLQQTYNVKSNIKGNY